MAADRRTGNPPVIFFDVVETVFSLSPLADKLHEHGLPAGSARLFFAQLLRDAFALSASGVFHSFPEIAKGSLTVLLDSFAHPADDTTLKDILGAFSRLPPHNDVRPALEKIKRSECRAVFLTNGSKANTEQLVRDSGLKELVDGIISVEDFKVWKPKAELYRLAAEQQACEPANALLIAAHAWDIHGALRAGFHGIWVERQESLYHPLMGNPGGQVGNLLDAVELALYQLQ